MCYNLLLPKGKKETLQIYVAEKGESLNGFINRAIEELLQREAIVRSDPPDAPPE